jgi:hypothetical protein
VLRDGLESVRKKRNIHNQSKLAQTTACKPRPADSLSTIGPADRPAGNGANMIVIPVTSLKVALPFKAGQLPVAIDPDNPSFVIDLDGLRVLCKINAKAARKLRVHNETGGGAVLSGKLQVVNGELTLVEGGFQFLSKPDDSAAGGSTA